MSEETGQPARQHQSTRPTLQQLTIFSPGASIFFSDGPATYTGGAELQTLQIARFAARLGARVRIITINAPPAPALPGQSFEVVSAWRSSQGAIVKLLGLLRSVIAAPSPVYARVSRPVLEYALVVLLARITGKRVVVGLASDLMTRKHRPASAAGLLSRVILRLSSRVIAQTEAQAVLLRANFDVQAVVIANFVDGPRFLTARRAGFGDRSIDAAWIGSIDPRKNPEFLIEVARKLPERRFAVIGGPLPGDAQFYADFANRAKSIPNIELTGFVDPEQLPAWLARTRVLVHTAGPVREDTMKEGFPNVFLEAWASGIPVISLNADPSGLLARHGLGVLCETEAEAAAHIERIAGSESEWQSYRDRAIAYAVSRDISAPGVLDEMLMVLAGDRPFAASER